MQAELWLCRSFLWCCLTNIIYKYSTLMVKKIAIIIIKHIANNKKKRETFDIFLISMRKIAGIMKRFICMMICALLSLQFYCNYAKITLSLKFYYYFVFYDFYCFFLLFLLAFSFLLSLFFSFSLTLSHSFSFICAVLQLI